MATSTTVLHRFVQICIVSQEQKQEHVQEQQRTNSYTTTLTVKWYSIRKKMSTDQAFREREGGRERREKEREKMVGWLVEKICMRKECLFPPTKLFSFLLLQVYIYTVDSLLPYCNLIGKVFETHGTIT